MPSRADKCRLVARECGWTVQEGSSGLFCAVHNGVVLEYVWKSAEDARKEFPDYYTDRTACAEALQVVKERVFWWPFAEHLWAQLSKDGIRGWSGEYAFWLGVIASAAQIAEALWLTFAPATADPPGEGS